MIGRRVQARSPRNPRSDRQTIAGGLTLVSVVLVLLVVAVALAWVLGATRGWSPVAWGAVALVAGALVSLELLFLHDYRRLARPGQPAARGRAGQASRGQ